MDFINDFNHSDDEDEDILDFIDYLNRPRRPKMIRARPNHFEMWDDHDFYVRFRFSKRSANFILEQIEDQIRHQTNWNNALSPANMLLLALRFYATGCILITAGDFVGVSKSTTSLVIAKVSDVIARLCNRYIRFPTTQEDIARTKQQFYRIARFPRVVGALDCTHVKLLSPGGDNAEVYRNRKGFFSINVQTVCDAKLRILDVVARWPGSAHDSTIFNNSILRGRFESGIMGDSLLVADGGYQNRNYMVTPLLQVNTPAENLYNESQIRTRNCVERSYGVWKRRFPVLSVGIRLNINKVRSVIVATAVLHNIACMHDEIVLPPLEPNLEAQINFVNVRHQNAHQNVRTNNTTRNHLINDYFRNLL